MASHAGLKCLPYESMGGCIFVSKYVSNLSLINVINQDNEEGMFKIFIYGEQLNFMLQNTRTAIFLEKYVVI